MAARAATRRGLVTAGLLLPALLFLAFWFVLPLGELFVLSFSDKRGAFAAYAELLEGEVYRRVFINTVVLGAGVTLACVLLAYPTAYVLTRLRGAWLYLAFWCVLFPFWVGGTIVGALAGDVVGDPERLGFDGALPALFLALLVLQLVDRDAKIAAVAGGAVALVLLPITPPGVPVIAAAVVCLWGLRKR